MLRLFPWIAILAFAPPLAAAGLELSNAWLRESPPVALPLAGYLTVTNTGADDVTVASLTAAEFSRIEWHATAVVDGIASMHRLPPPTIAAGESLTLAPGGQHLMLFDPARRLAAGDSVELTLTLDDGEVFHVTAEVRAAAPDPHHHHSMHTQPAPKE